MTTLKINIEELHIHLDGVERVFEKLAVIEANQILIKETIMIAKDDILATVATETQEVLAKIAADRAEIDAAQAALVVAQADLATEQANVAAAQADIAAKAVLIADLQQQIADLIAAGGGISQADLVLIDDAIKNIFNPAQV